MSYDIRKDHPKSILKEKVIARLEKGGETFEILVDPNVIQEIREGKEVDLREHLAIDDVFRDVKKGERASREKMEELFGSRDPIDVARIIVRKGEIQLTTEQRRAMQEEKRKAIISMIASNAINPQTGTPHPPQRIEIAMNEAKVNIDPFKSADEQIDRVLDALRPLLPIRFEVIKVAVKLSAGDCAKCYGDIKSFGKIVQEEWQKDGTWIGLVEMPAGLQTEFFNRLNEKTKGHVETKIVK